MIDRFLMNGYLWRIKFVNPNSSFLIDRTDHVRVATTDPHTKCIYLSNELYGRFLTTVLIHELGHCVMFSYDLIRDIHSAVYPEYWIDAEEWVCNFIADYGFKIFSVAYSVMGKYAWLFVPQEIEKLIA